MMPIFTLILISLLWCIYDKKRYSRYPPGPPRLPTIGNLHQISRISKYPGKAFYELSKTYGDPFFVRMGTVDTIIFNSLDSIKEIRNHEFCQNRATKMVPALWERQERKEIGINFANGKEQQAIRRFTIRTLREFGFGKSSSMDNVINEELSKFKTHLDQLMTLNPSGIPQAHTLFDLTITNISWRLVTGVDYDLNDAKIKKLLDLSEQSFRSISFSKDLAIAYPFLYHLFPDWMGKSTLKRLFGELNTFIKDLVEHHRRLGEYKINPKSFMDVFLAKIDEEKDLRQNETVFRDEQLIMTLLDLFQDTAHTTSNTISFCMLYMLYFPEVQRKCQEEIDKNVESNETILISHKDKLPYTFATLQECLRYSSVITTPAASEVSQSFYYKGYLIEKGTHVLPNLYAVHYSEDVWGNPENFRPERFFLNEECKELNGKLLSHVIPFNVNCPRMCIGISLAESFLFIYFATILRDFKLEKGCGPGEDISIEPEVGLAQSPKPYKLKYIPR